MHFLTVSQDHFKDRIDDDVKIAELLLNTAPKMVNTLSKYDETPIDVAHRLTDRYQAHNEKLIALFKERGGKTAQQLKQDQKFINKIKKSYFRTDLSRE